MGGRCSRISRGTPEARSHLCVCRASFLMNFATGGVPHAGPGSDRISVELFQILTQYAICQLPATDLESDILECEVKWALESITTNKASGGDGMPVELFQILKDDAVKVLHSISQQTWKTQQWPQDWKRSVFIPIPKKGNAKECSNYHTIALISHASKVMLKILQARLQQYGTVNFHMF